MLTIKNHSERVVIIYNKYFEKEISINGTVVIYDEEIHDDYTIKIKYFSLRNEQKKTTIDVKRDFRRKLSVDLYNESQFPIITTLDVQNIDHLILKKDDIPLPFLALFFKRVVLKHISCSISSKSNPLFCNKNDKKRLLRLIKLELLFTIPITLILALMTTIFWIDKSEFGIVIVSIILTVLFTFCSCWNIYYYKASQKWEVDNY